ncbi:MAG: Hpt domain-containing protein [Deltaproteobacteria bacterium]|nr:Hpt domain-containing protein [Deltaproteobacteria bacterium]
MKNQENPQLDLSYLASIVGQDNTEGIFSLLKIFIEDFTEISEQLGQAVMEKNPDTVKRQAHAAKGAAMSAGAGGLAELLKKMEAESLLGSWEDLEDLMVRVKAEFSAVITYYRENAPESCPL